MFRVWTKQLVLGEQKSRLISGRNKEFQAGYLIICWLQGAEMLARGRVREVPLHPQPDPAYCRPCNLGQSRSQEQGI